MSGIGVMILSGWVGVWSVSVHSNCAAIGSPSDIVFRRRNTSEHIRTEKTRGLWILVAPVTAQEHKEIFLLCHYFARRKKRINSNPPTSDKTNPPIHRRNTATLTMVQQTIRGNIDGVAYRPEVAPWGSRHKSGIESKDAIQGETNTLLPL